MYILSLSSYTGQHLLENFSRRFKSPLLLSFVGRRPQKGQWGFTRPQEGHRGPLLSQMWLHRTTYAGAVGS